MVLFVMQTSIKSIFIILLFFILVFAMPAQTEFPSGNYWSLDAGLGMSDILVDGMYFQFIIDPKFWLSPPLMVGSRMGAGISTDQIVTFEGQVYLRWNFLRLGKDKTFNIFTQAGIGLLAAYKGEDNPFDDVTMTRGSLVADAMLGVTIPLTSRFHIEPSVRAGYPHICGFSLTAGVKFPLKKNSIEYILQTVPPVEITKVIMISSVEYIIFGPDLETYNTGIDNDARQLNELVLNHTAQVLKENPNFHVRIEGHSNPLTLSPSEIDDLNTLSLARANTVAAKLREKGVSEDQMVIAGVGGSRIATNEFEARNRNRRVELMIMSVETTSKTRQ